MGERVEALTLVLKTMDECQLNMLGTKYYTDVLLSHIAMNLAVIADKLTEDDNGDNQ